jgi:hypothetical protein
MPVQGILEFELGLPKVVFVHCRSSNHCKTAGTCVTSGRVLNLRQLNLQSCLCPTQPLTAASGYGRYLRKEVKRRVEEEEEDQLTDKPSYSQWQGGAEIVWVLQQQSSGLNQSAKKGSEDKAEAYVHSFILEEDEEKNEGSNMRTDKRVIQSAHRMWQY